MQANILLVDGDSGILDDLKNLLQDEPCKILEARRASDAMAIMQKETIHLLLTVFTIPEGSGLSLCQQAREMSPSTYRILLSARVDYTKLQPAWRLGDMHLLVNHPPDEGLLLRHIKEGLKQQQLLQQADTLLKGVKNERLSLMTDNNWVIRLANNPLCKALKLDENQLLGKNLFSARLSSTPFELEAEVTRQVEAHGSWLGPFHFLSSSKEKCTCWMTVTSISEQYRLCLCLPTEHNTDHDNTWENWKQDHVSSLRNQLPAPYPVNTGSKSTTASRENRQTPSTPAMVADLKSRPIFKLNGELSALLAPDGIYQQDDWHHWLRYLHQIWQYHFAHDLILLFPLAEQSIEQAKMFFYAVLDYQQQNKVKWQLVFIMNEQQLVSNENAVSEFRADLHQARCQLFLAHFGRSFLNSRQIQSLAIQGVVLAPEFLPGVASNHATTQSRRLLQRLKSQHLTILAPELDSTSGLATARKCDVDWLAGDALSGPLSIDQLKWFANPQNNLD